jgi:hypothetical protein
MLDTNKFGPGGSWPKESGTPGKTRTCDTRSRNAIKGLQRVPEVHCRRLASDEMTRNRPENRSCRASLPPLPDHPRGFGAISVPSALPTESHVHNPKTLPLRPEALGAERRPLTDQWYGRLTCPCLDLRLAEMPTENHPNQRRVANACPRRLRLQLREILLSGHALKMLPTPSSTSCTNA